MLLDPLVSAFDRPPTALDASHGVGRAAVALVLDQQGDILFMRRAEKAGDPWSGHVSLPGGHVEGVETFREAAMRETLEEVGLDLARATMLGMLDDSRTPSTLPTKVIRPFVFRVPHFGALSLQRSEVASVHPLALTALLAGEGRTTFSMHYGGADWTLPCVNFAGGRLWGLTLRVVDDLLDRIDGGGIGLARNPDATEK